MRTYNIYYNNEKVNKVPVSKEDADKIRSQQSVTKAGKVLSHIPVNRLRFVEVVTF